MQKTTLLWTWRGAFFGYREDDALWTYQGKHVGWFRGEEVYSMTGNYIGELESKERLITKSHKKHLRAPVFAPYAQRSSIVRYVNYVGYVMYAGCEDFPLPENL